MFTDAIDLPALDPPGELNANANALDQLIRGEEVKEYLN